MLAGTAQTQNGDGLAGDALDGDHVSFLSGCQVRGLSAPHPEDIYARMKGLTQFQRGEADQRQHQRDDPEADHDLAFLPAFFRSGGWIGAIRKTRLPVRLK